MKKIILITSLIILFSGTIVLAQDLEVDYPDIPGPTITPETTNTPLVYYFEYVYYFIVAIAGLIGLLVLVYAGAQYVTSAGNPDQLEKAKKRIFAALLGLLILALSYAILYNINPELVDINIPSLQDIVLTPGDIDPIQSRIPRLLATTEDLARKILIAVQRVNELSTEIRNDFLECSCLNSTSLCWCTGGQDSDTCEPHQCFGGNEYHPCEHYEEMRENLRQLVAWRDELLYYRNRAAGEIADLNDEIEGVLNDRVRYYQEMADNEHNPAVREYLQEHADLVRQEIALKRSLIDVLTEIGNKPERDEDEFDDWIKLLALQINEFLPLLDRCIIDDVGDAGLNNNCQGECLELPATPIDRGECHDTMHGCQGLPCTVREGGMINPCPIDEVLIVYGEITTLTPLISAAAQNVLGIIGSIRNLKANE